MSESMSSESESMSSESESMSSESVSVSSTDSSVETVSANSSSTTNVCVEAWVLVGVENGNISAVFVRFHVVTRVIGVVSSDDSLDWNISGPGLVLSLIDDLFLISEGSLVGDDGHISVCSGGDSAIFGVLLDVVPDLALGLVLSLILDSVVGVEDGFIPDLVLLSVVDFVLIGVSGLFNILVVGLGVWAVEVLDFVSVSVFFLLSVENLVARLVDSVWDISEVGLGVVVIDDSGYELVLGEVVWCILHFVVGREPLFFVCLVLSLRLGVEVGDWDLS